MAAAAEGLHALLIGIDHYPTRPLSGCVNDVLAVEAWLVEVAQLPRERITRLISGAGTEPTCANIRAAFAALACAVRPGDRAFIYFSGHGAQELQVLAPKVRGAREAIVPLDAWPVGGGPRHLLWDCEMNRLLRALVDAKAHVTCVLDSCHSAGATRAPAPFEAGALDASEVRQAVVDGRDEVAPEGIAGFAASAGSGGWAQIVACEASELAREANVGDRGERHGLLTRALLHALRDVTADRAHQIRWSEVWHEVLGRVGTWNPAQHPRLFEAWSRPILGGASRDSDIGVRISRDGDSAYRVHAGTYAGLDRGARLAVYDATPEVFPKLGSDNDLRARRGILEIIEAHGSTATAKPIGDGPVLHPGSRGRVVRDAPAQRLVVLLDPASTNVAQVVSQSADRMRPAIADEPGDIWVVTRPDGSVRFGDDCYTSTDDASPRSLLQIAHPTEAELAAILDRLQLYRQPIKTARRCRGLDGELALELLDCSDLAKLSGDALQDPDLSLVPDTDGILQLQTGQKFCVRVKNHSSTELAVVSLLCCTSDGQVELWSEELVPARGRATFWQDGIHGKPFEAWIPKDRDAAIERIIAIGTTVAGTTFAHFELKGSFTRLLKEVARGGYNKDHDDDDAPPERWVGVIREMLIMRR